MPKVNNKNTPAGMKAAMNAKMKADMPAKKSKPKK